MSFQQNQRYQYNFPTSIRFGRGVIDELGPHLKEQGLKRVLLVSDLGLVKLPVFERVISQIKASGVLVEVFSRLQRTRSSPMSLRVSLIFTRANVIRLWASGVELAWMWRGQSP